MKMLPPLPDRHLVGQDQGAQLLAITHKTGLGLLPTHIGEFGWFGAEHIRTMLADCGCGQGEDCRNLKVYYVVVEDAGYHFLYDDEGELCVCTPQTYAYQAKEVEEDTVHTYLDAIQDQFLKITDPMEAHLSELMDLAHHASASGDLSSFLRNFRSSSPEEKVYLLNRAAAQAAAQRDHQRRLLTQLDRAYITRLDSGEPLESVVRAMHQAGVDSEVIQVLEHYHEAWQQYQQLDHILSKFPGSEHIH